MPTLVPVPCLAGPSLPAACLNPSSALPSWEAFLDGSEAVGSTPFAVVLNAVRAADSWPCLRQLQILLFWAFVSLNTGPGRHILLRHHLRTSDVDGEHWTVAVKSKWGKVLTLQWGEQVIDVNITSNKSCRYGGGGGGGERPLSHKEMGSVPL